MDFQRKKPNQRIFAEHGRNIEENALVEGVRVLGRVAELDGGAVVAEQHQKVEHVQQSQQERERHEEEQVHEDPQNVQRLEEVLGCELSHRMLLWKNLFGMRCGFLRLKMNRRK